MITRQDLHRMVDALPDELLDEAGRSLAELEAGRRAGPLGANEQLSVQPAAEGPQQPLQPGDLSLRRE
jgi:hypothetical protein